MDNLNIGGVRISPKPFTQTTGVQLAGASVGDAVTMTAANTFGRGAAGDPFDGVVMSAERDGKGTVGRGGRLAVKVSASLGPGTDKNLTVNGAGLVTAAAGDQWRVIGEETKNGVLYALVERR